MPESEVAVYSVKITPPSAILADINKQMLSSPKRTAVAVKRNTGRLRSRHRAALRVKPAPAQNFYPLRYASARQRRKVHAMRRARGGGAYVRTDALINAWIVNLIALVDHGEITVENRNPAAGFVYSEFRQPMFNPLAGGIPWLDPDEVNTFYATQYELVLEATWHTESDPHAGVR